MEESVEGWNTSLWDPATDTLYLAGLVYADANHYFLRWLSDRRQQPYVGFNSVMRVALKLDYDFMLATKLIHESPYRQPHYFDNMEDQ
jgi:hypothetical protein